MTNGQEVDRPTTVLRLLQQPATKQELARALHGTGIAVDYFLRIVQTDVRRSPGLQKCSPESFMGALLTSAQLGLRVGILGEAYLIPRAGEAMFQAGYQGWMTLARNAGGKIYCGVVYPEDSFDSETGTANGGPWVHHKAALDAEHEDRRILAVWAEVDSANGERHIAVLSHADVNRHRERYAGRDKRGKFNSPWLYDFEGGQWPQMAMKTAIIQAIKYAPKSTQMERALEAEYKAEPNPQWDVEGSATEAKDEAPAKADGDQLQAVAVELNRTGYTWESVQEWCRREGFPEPAADTDLLADCAVKLIPLLASLPAKDTIPEAGVSTHGDTATTREDGPTRSSDPEVVDGEATEEPAETPDERAARAEKLRTQANASGLGAAAIKSHLASYGASKLAQCSSGQLDEFAAWLSEELAHRAGGAS